MSKFLGLRERLEASLKSTLVFLGTYGTVLLAYIHLTNAPVISNHCPPPPPPLVYNGYIAFPYIMHCIHLSHFFGASSENICPIYSLVHSLSKSVSHLNSVFSFKIHCLQMLQLFQTKKGSIFFIVTFVYSSYIVFPYIMHLSTLVTLF